MKKKTSLVKVLGSHSACRPAVDWVRTVKGRSSWEAVWKACVKADWLFWACQEANVKKKLQVKALCRIWEQEIATLDVEGREKVAFELIKLVRRWVNGKVNLKEISDLNCEILRDGRQMTDLEIYVSDIADFALGEEDICPDDIVNDIASYRNVISREDTEEDYYKEPDASLKRQSEIVRQTISFKEVMKAYERTTKKALTE